MQALVHLAVLGERRVLAMVRDHHVVERLRVDERVAEQPCRGHALPVVAEHADARLHHVADLGERLALEPFRGRPPTGKTSQRPAAAARSRTSWITPAWSATGSVLAMGATAV